MKARNRNELWGHVLLDELARAGARHLVVCPGSRSTPLVLAAASNAQLRVRVQIDERSAGFVGLGIGKASGRPAVIVTTSGTAVANLLPAVVEAAQSATPLVLLTADRPAHLRGADANQTIRQTGIFGDYARRFEELAAADVNEATLRHLRSAVARSMAAAIGDPAGPVHLNVPLAKPLEPISVPGDLPPELSEGRSPAVRGRDGGEPWTAVEPRRSAPSREVVSEVVEALRRAERPLLVAGVLPRPREVGPVLRHAARTLEVPLLADALSGARYGDPGVEAPRVPVVGGYDIALRHPSVAAALQPDLVIRFGAAPTSSSLDAWLSALHATPHLLVDGGGRWKDHAGTATRVVPSDPVRFLDALLDAAPAPERRDAWLERWRRVDRAVAEGIAERSSQASFEGAVVERIIRRVGPDDLVFVSNSMPVRDLDAFVPGPDRALQAFGNRGASGIDGIVSTAAGISLSTGRRVVAIVGDLAFLHDSNGLATLRESDVRVLVVVLNNDGGGIFHMLPVREFEPPFTSLFATPHGRRLELLAELHGLPYLQVDVRGRGEEPAQSDEGVGKDEEIATGWTRASRWEGSGVLELRTDREENHRQRARAVREIAALAATAIS